MASAQQVNSEYFEEVKSMKKERGAITLITLVTIVFMIYPFYNQLMYLSIEIDTSLQNIYT